MSVSSPSVPLAPASPAVSVNWKVVTSVAPFVVSKVRLPPVPTLIPWVPPPVVTNDSAPVSVTSPPESTVDGFAVTVSVA